VTVILLISSLLLPFLMGYLLVLNVWAGTASQTPSETSEVSQTSEVSETSEVFGSALPARLLRVILGAGLGLGLASLLSFAGLLLAGPSPAFSYVAELGLCVLLGTLLVVRRGPSLRGFFKRQPAQRREIDRVFLAGFAIILAPAIASMVLASLRLPHGHWDAWAIWNLHARFLYRGGAAWTNLFSLQFSHPDYPLLLPALVARGWMYAGSETQAAPAMLSILYTLLAAGLLAVGLAHLRGTAHGATAGAILAGTPFVVAQAAGQLADTPLAFYILATLVCLLLADASPAGRRGFTILAGVAAGCAAWTKHEGFAFLLLLILTIVAVRWWTRQPRLALGQVGAVLAGALPFACAWLYLKMRLAPPNSIASMLTFAHVTTMLLRPARYIQIARAFAGTIFHFGDWPIAIVPLLALAAPLLGLSLKKEHRAGFGIAVVLLGLMLAVYAGVYLVTLPDVVWHLQSSLERLLLQLWPSALLAYFLVIRMPVFARRET